ncbi:hypothetical protein C0Q70_20503 [Pomacea canaliculata]|uniref:Uncharacterized protein n=1 Tax=Pomacea canaliculata TaxID=400727 RepID=A0A2T7NFQ8_POMCA|nr:hypothetical protein C0Q70_20503 [Pomacea canaliculata]
MHRCPLLTAHAQSCTFITWFRAFLPAAVIGRREARQDDETDWWWQWQAGGKRSTLLQVNQTTADITRQDKPDHFLTGG